MNKNNKLMPILLVMTAMLFLVPIYWLAMSSFKTNIEISQVPATFFPKIFTLSAYPKVWKALKFAQTFRNSLFVSTVTTILIVINSTMAGYAFAKKEFIGKNIIMVILVGIMTIPATVLLLPLFFTIKSIGLYNNLFGLIVPFSVTIFGIFFMQQYIADVPDSLIEAARIDGASELQIFTKVVVPLIKPGIITLGTIEFVNNWNSFTMPLVLLKSPNIFTLPLRLGLMTQNKVEIEWPAVMAGNVLSILPVVIIFLILQKRIKKGMMDGAVKG